MSDFPDPAPPTRNQWLTPLLARAANPSFWLMGTLISLFHMSLGEANWVSEQEAAYIFALWLGGLLGMMLAASRFRGRLALAYSLFLFVCFAAQSVGHILPASIGALSTSDWIGDMHVRLIALAFRVWGWGGALAQSERIHDTGLFIVVLSLLAWHISAWLAWGVSRWRNALAAVLPMGLALALNVHLDGQPLMALWLFLGVAVVLVARTSFLRAHSDWDRRQVDYPDGLGLDWAASALVLAFVIGAVARAGPIVGTPQGWRLINEWLLQARAQVAETTGDLFADVNPPPVYRQPVSASAANLEQIGAPLDQRPDTVFWVTVSDPPPPPPQSYQPNPRPHYWRNAVFDTYLGPGWQRAEAVDALESVSTSALNGRYILNQHFEMTALHGGDLFAVNTPFSITGEVNLRFLGPDQSAVLEGPSSTSAYEVVSWATDVDADRLSAASDQYPEAIRAAYLQLPGALPQRVRDLAHQITSGSTTPYAKALRLQTYLRQTRPYRLDVPPPPSGQDAVDYFLFNAPGGFCSYYASAMAVMLRAEGVPARVVTGYAMGEFNYERHAYRVPASAAHAWVEVYFPDYGWVEFEPTAALSAFQYGELSTPPTLAAQAPPLPEIQRPPLAWLWGLRLALAALLVVGTSLVWQWRLARRRTPRQQVLAVYWAARRALGFAAPASTTPNEFLAAASSALDSLPQVFSALRELTALYLRAAFCPRPILPEEARLAQTIWRQAWPAWGWRRLTRRAKPNR